MLSGWQHILLQNLYVLFSINGTFRNVSVSNAKGTNTPPYHHRCWLFKLTLVAIWIVLFLFSLEDTTSMISNLKYEKVFFFKYFIQVNRLICFCDFFCLFFNLTSSCE